MLVDPGLLALLHFGIVICLLPAPPWLLWTLLQPCYDATSSGSLKPDFMWSLSIAWSSNIMWLWVSSAHSSGATFCWVLPATCYVSPIYFAKIPGDQIASRATAGYWWVMLGKRLKRVSSIQTIGRCASPGVRRLWILVHGFNIPSGNPMWPLKSDIYIYMCVYIYIHIHINGVFD